MLRPLVATLTILAAATSVANAVPITMSPNPFYWKDEGIVLNDAIREFELDLLPGSTETVHHYRVTTVVGDFFEEIWGFMTNLAGRIPISIPQVTPISAGLTYLVGAPDGSRCVGRDPISNDCFEWEFVLQGPPGVHVYDIDMTFASPLPVGQVYTVTSYAGSLGSAIRGTLYYQASVPEAPVSLLTALGAIALATTRAMLRCLRVWR
jgi:hypothetical protein